jgi:hypothetical protein
MTRAYVLGAKYMGYSADFAGNKGHRAEVLIAQRFLSHAPLAGFSWDPGVHRMGELIELLANDPIALVITSALFVIIVWVVIQFVVRLRSRRRIRERLDE